jgi:hypothetical protein
MRWLAKPRQGLGFYRLLRRLVESDTPIREFPELPKNLQQSARKAGGQLFLDLMVRNAFAAEVNTQFRRGFARVYITPAA